MGLKEVVYVPTIPPDAECLLGADIGGTNSNFGFLMQHGQQLVLLLSIHAKSKDITDFTQLTKQILEYVKTKYHITMRYAAFAAAGVVSEQHDYVKPTNASFIIDSKAIIAATGLQCAFIVNDFAVIGHGISHINADRLVLINHGIPHLFANKAILGSGTGLGKSILVWNSIINRYIPLASEGGHTDFSAQDVKEISLIESIRNREHRTDNISWEDVLSGDGIRRIYTFFHERTGDTLQSHVPPHPDAIFESRDHDEHAYNTFCWYTIFYARCAKNWALDALSLGGIYIAGGIAAHNLALFQDPMFIDEFIRCGKHKDLLNSVPIYIITDYNVSLYGAAAYLLLEKMCGT